MSEEVKSAKSSKKELVKFGITLAIVFILWGVIFFWRKGKFYPQFFIGSFILFVSSFFWPLALRPLHKGLKALFIAVSWTLTRLILFILFYLILTPISFFSRLAGKKFLYLSFDNRKCSYWIQRPADDFNKQACENQF